jgi:hypothetical protein
MNRERERVALRGMRCKVKVRVSGKEGTWTGFSSARTRESRGLYDISISTPLFPRGRFWGEQMVEIASKWDGIKIWFETTCKYSHFETDWIVHLLDFSCLSELQTRSVRSNSWGEPGGEEIHWDENCDSENDETRKDQVESLHLGIWNVKCWKLRTFAYFFLFIYVCSWISDTSIHADDSHHNFHELQVIAQIGNIDENCTICCDQVSEDILPSHLKWNNTNEV